MHWIRTIPIEYLHTLRRKAMTEQKAGGFAQWLPRDRGTGEERILINSGGTARIYNLIDRAESLVPSITLSYFDEKMRHVSHTILLDSRKRPVSCSCPDHTERRNRCKHLKGLEAAMKQRRKRIEFG